VIVLGATNRIDLIDPSILRPGRFGVHIPVELPDADAREDILRICLRTESSNKAEIDAIIGAVVPLTDGFSGARLKQLCDDAKRTAIKRTGFKDVAAATIEDMRVALAAERLERQDARSR
jgi:SpoVK/Ycf46/Vps4 family AAA+-type ATPase